MGEVKNHGNNFALLHFIGACMVIYGHMHDLLQVPGPSLLGNGINALGVKMIFVITGYLVANSYLRELYGAASDPYLPGHVCLPFPVCRFDRADRNDSGYGKLFFAVLALSLE